MHDTLPSGRAAALVPFLTALAVVTIPVGATAAPQGDELAAAAERATVLRLADYDPQQLEAFGRFLRRRNEAIVVRPRGEWTLEQLIEAEQIAMQQSILRAIEATRKRQAQVQKQIETIAEQAARYDELGNAEQAARVRESLAALRSQLALLERIDLDTSRKGSRGLEPRQVGGSAPFSFFVDVLNARAEGDTQILETKPHPRGGGTIPSMLARNLADCVRQLERVFAEDARLSKAERQQVRCQLDVLRPMAVAAEQGDLRTLQELLLEQTRKLWSLELYHDLPKRIAAALAAEQAELAKQVQTLDSYYQPLKLPKILHDEQVEPPYRIRFSVERPGRLAIGSHTMVAEATNEVLDGAGKVLPVQGEEGSGHVEVEPGQVYTFVFRVAGGTSFYWAR